MFELYKSGFFIENNKLLNRFAAEIIKISEEYIRFLILKGRLISYGELNSYDTAVDLTAELFTVESGCLVHFKRFFEGLNVQPATEEEFYGVLKKFVYTAALYRMENVFTITDPVTKKMHRSLRGAISEEGYKTTDIFSNRYVHRKKIDFESALCIEKNMLLRLLHANNGEAHKSPKSFINFVFDALESQNEYLHAVPFADLLLIYKEYFCHSYRAAFQKTASSPETSIYLRLLLEEVKKSFAIKLNKYINKKNFSEKEKNCIYNIVEEIINCYTNGNERESVQALIEKYLEGTHGKGFRYKVEYVLDRLNSEIISLIQREENTYVGKLSE